jgi:hypothetical protein
VGSGVRSVMLSTGRVTEPLLCIVSTLCSDGLPGRTGATGRSGRFLKGHRHGASDLDVVDVRRPCPRVGR